MHPVTEGREAGPAWIPRWRFRLAAVILLAVAVLIVIIGYHYYSGAGDGTRINNIPRALEHLGGYGDNRLRS